MLYTMCSVLCSLCCVLRAAHLRCPTNLKAPAPDVAQRPAQCHCAEHLGRQQRGEQPCKDERRCFSARKPQCLPLTCCCLTLHAPAREKRGAVSEQESLCGRCLTRCMCPREKKSAVFEQESLPFLDVLPSHQSGAAARPHPHPAGSSPPQPRRPSPTAVRRRPSYNDCAARIADSSDAATFAAFGRCGCNTEERVCRIAVGETVILSCNAAMPHALPIQDMINATSPLVCSRRMQYGATIAAHALPIQATLVQCTSPLVFGRCGCSTEEMGLSEAD